MGEQDQDEADETEYQNGAMEVARNVVDSTLERAIGPEELYAMSLDYIGFFDSEETLIAVVELEEDSEE
uniref:Uncharacterized protein n=1 Tax=Solanum lycopersicum TaxID=4081 RepID=A0A3Q7EY41_SOLLC